jgi:hypothetical protein
MSLHFRFRYTARIAGLENRGNALNVRIRDVSNVNKELYGITCNTESMNKIYTMHMIGNCIYMYGTWPIHSSLCFWSLLPFS